MAAWSPAEIQALRAVYESCASKEDINLPALATSLGRLKSNVSRKARSLGLTNPSRPNVNNRKARRKFADADALRDFQSKRMTAWIAENGHARGMAGKKHTEETKALLSKSSTAAKAALTAQERRDIAQKAKKTMVERHGSAAPMTTRGTWKAGWREIGGYRKFYRSRWESNYARYLQWLKERGEILDWKHEPETFWFDAIKRGVRSYLPDFRVWERDGSSRLHEVKGWMDARSKTTLKRMAKYHPSETIVVVREKDYNAIAKTVGPMINGWEGSERSGRW